MTIQELQKKVDQWITTFGIRYFDEKTNSLLLVEEVGEFCSLIARKFGEQNFKKTKTETEIDIEIQDEMGDILFVFVCLANQMGYNLEEIMISNLEKKTSRDHSRHQGNPKLKGA